MLRWMILIFIALSGCASNATPTPPEPRDVVFIVAGVNGGSGYGGLVKALANERRLAHVVSWGAPPPMFFMNFSNKSVHDGAEQKLADQLTAWHQAHPGGTIDVIAHSAGCGVALGTLARAGDTHVRQVVLLAPSVSPTYDLHPALLHVDGVVHVFHSERDTTFLDWRTRNFGTYDRIKTKAAGNSGFVGEWPNRKVVQHAYDPQWRYLGNDGGHFGTLSQQFASDVIVPLLQQ